MPIRTITSRHNPLVRAIRSLAAAPDPAGSRLLLDGAHLVQAALDARLPLETVIVSTSHLDRDTEEGRLVHALRDQPVDIVAAEVDVFDALSPVRTPSGLLAVVTRSPTTLPAILAIGDPLLLVAVDVQDPGNLGSLIRSAEASGASALIACGVAANPFSWKALRGSMGSALRLPIVGGLAIDDVLCALEHAGITTIASTVTGGDDPETARWSGPVALFLGGEGSGLRPDLVGRCHARVTIPMSPPVDSLNVAVSGALLMYAARRQRRIGRSTQPAAPIETW